MVLLALAVIDVGQVVKVLGKRIGRLRTTQLDHGGQPKGCGQLAQTRCASGGANVIRDLFDRLDERAQLVGQQLKAVAVEPFPQLAICPAGARRFSRSIALGNAGIEHKRQSGLARPVQKLVVADAHELCADVQPVGEPHALGARIGDMPIGIEQMIALGNLACLATGPGGLNLERNLLQLSPGVVVKRAADAVQVVGDAKATGRRANDAEPRNDCNDAADNKATAGHGIVTGLLQDLSCALAGDVDLKVRARIDINCGLVSCALAVLRFCSGEVCRERLEHLLLGGAIALFNRDAFHDDLDERLVVIASRLERYRPGLGLYEVERAGCRGTRRLNIERFATAVELVQNARKRIDVDRGRAAKGRDAFDILREHLGRGVCGRGKAPNVGTSGDRVVAEGHGRGAHVDEAGVKGAIGNLLLKRSAGGAEHDIGRRKVAMDDRIHEALGHQERAKHGVSDGGHHLGGQPARGVVRKQRQRLLERGALDPLHEDKRVVLARSVAIDARKSAQVRDGTQMTVLLEQRGGVGQVRGRLLGGAVGGLAGKDGVVLE